MEIKPGIFPGERIIGEAGKLSSKRNPIPETHP
jgi:hypothetical protein